MSPNWNFREILDVYPESDSFECVGIKECDDSKCFNKRPLLSDMDLSKAGKMLDDMDHIESLKTSFEYLDEVARNCLCVVHSDASIDQVVERWRNKIVLHMQKEIASNARPQTRRSIGRPRGSSQSLMAVVEEHREAQAPLSASSALGAETTTRPRPSRNMSSKISSLISEVGFHDESNENYSPIEKPTKSVPARPGSRLLRRDTPHVTNSISEQPKVDQWASEQLSSLLSRPHPLLASKQVTQQDLEDGLVEFVEGKMGSTRPRGLTSDTMKAAPPTPRNFSRFSRTRSDTTSSSGSSARSRGRSYTSSAGSEAGSSPPSSRSSSTNPSPALKATNLEEGSIKPISMPKPVLRRASTVSGGSPEPLPKFDFGIFSNLPLPPGHKRHISEQNKRMSLTSESFSVFENDPGYKPITQVQRSELEPEISAFPVPTKDEKSSAFLDVRRTSSVKPLLPRRSSDRLRVTIDSKPSEKPILLRPKTPAYNIVSPIEESGDETSWLATEPTPQLERAGSSSWRPRSHIDGSLLPEHDSVLPIRTSWIVSPLSRQPSRRTSRANSFSLSRTSSRRSSRATSPDSRSQSPAPTAAAAPLSRRPSLLTRTLSRTLSRSRSTSKSRPQTATPENKRYSFHSPPQEQGEILPLNRLIQMSHELARKLDGYEDHGYVTVRPSSSYKYRLPRGQPANEPALPELRMSRLFIGLDLETESHRKYSQLDFQIPRKAVAAEVQAERDEEEVRGRHIDIAQRPAPRASSMGTRDENMAQAIRAERMRQVQAEREDRVPFPMMEPSYDVCGVCGGTHGLLWKCGRAIERAVMERGDTRKSVDMKSRRKSTKTVKKQERAAGRPRRGTTLRRIRMRVQRAFTV